MAKLFGILRIAWTILCLVPIFIGLTVAVIFMQLSQGNRSARDLLGGIKEGLDG